MKLNNGWDVSIERVGPSEAATMLAQNSGNRKLRPGVVKRYSATMSSGNWQLTTESIVFSEGGVLMNGQHRLSAVIDSGVSVEFMVIRGVNINVFQTIDRGAGRSISDALGIDRGLAQISRLAASIVARQNTLVDQNVKYISDYFSEPYFDLVSRCNTAAAGISSAPVRLAACMRMVESEDPEYILSLYRNLCLAKIHDLPPIGAAFIARQLSGKNKSGGAAAQLDMLGVGLRLFDKKSSQSARIVSIPPAIAKEEVFRLLGDSFR